MQQKWLSLLVKKKNNPLKAPRENGAELLDKPVKMTTLQEVATTTGRAIKYTLSNAVWIYNPLRKI